MPVELDFWAENLNKNYRSSGEIYDYATSKHHKKGNRTNFSIFETE